MAAADKQPWSPAQANQAVGQLLSDLFGDRPSDLAIPIAHWAATSKPFLAFAQLYQSKIRKKARICRDAEETYNLYCELRTAYLLLQEPTFAVAYEPSLKEPGRSADFAVTFRTHTTFHVEVTRLRTSQQEQQLSQETAGASGPEDPMDFIRRYEGRRMADVVCEKLGQMSPATANVLWIWGGSRVIHELDVEQVMLDLKRRAEQRDAGLYARYGFAKPADFIRDFQRLSAILVQSLHPQGGDRSTHWWQNKDSRHPFPAKVAHRLLSSVAADPSLPFTAGDSPDGVGSAEGQF